MPDRYFADNCWIQGLLNPRDPYHVRCVEWHQLVRNEQIVTTEAVLTESATH